MAGERDRPSGIVRINAHRTAALLHILPKLRTLREVHPGVIIDLAVDDRLVDIVAGGVRCGHPLRRATRSRHDCDARGPREHAAVVAAPEYITGRPAILSPADLLQHDYLIWSSRTYGEWRRSSALTKCGVTYVLREQVIEHLNSGQLVEVLSDYAVQHDACFLYYPDRKQMRPAMRAVIA
ncbi:LysR substrate-binding domain-containing protein [Pseudomonas spelaei]